MAFLTYIDAYEKQFFRFVTACCVFISLCLLLRGKATWLHKVTIDYGKCAYCKTCVIICPWGVYEDMGDRVEVVHMKDCVCCMSCVAPCPTDAITVEEDPVYLNK